MLVESTGKRFLIPAVCQRFSYQSLLGFRYHSTSWWVGIKIGGECVAPGSHGNQCLNIATGLRAMKNA